MRHNLVLCCSGSPQSSAMRSLTSCCWTFDFGASLNTRKSVWSMELRVDVILEVFLFVAAAPHPFSNRRNLAQQCLTARGGIS
jgi:hypothetical protein